MKGMLPNHNPMSANDDLMDMLTGVMSQINDMNNEFMTIRNIDALIANSIKSKVPPLFLCRIYELGTLIQNLRTARWAAYVNYERSNPIVNTEDDPTDVVPALDKPESTDDVTKALTYQEFVKKMRPAVKAAHSDLTTQEIIVEVARLWNEEKKKLPAEATDSKGGGAGDSAKEEKPKKSKASKTEESGDSAKPKKIKLKLPKEPTPEPVENPVPPTAAVPVPVPVPVPVQEPVLVKKATGRPKKTTTVVAPEPAPAPAPAPAPVPVPVTAEEEPIATRRKAIPKHVKSLVWNRYVGENRAESQCLCCRSTRIAVTNFHCGHVVAEAKGGDLTVPNLRPICAPCNLSMGTMSMSEFAKTYFGWDVV
jgi:hypothetical protein